MVKCAKVLSLVAAATALTENDRAWDDAYRRARELLARMAPEQKYHLMQGHGWNGMVPQPGEYTGQILADASLGMPSINAQDAAGGVRTEFGTDNFAGTATAWPSQLSLAATFDLATVRSFGEALGSEFAGKGVNMVLGPSINVHRSALGGRNFEYLSGEDPYLGAKLVREWVQGVQSKGVMTTTKHYVFNQQETNRMHYSSVVDNQTAWELYYPPFQAAVDAGTTAFMCSYNQVDGESTCANGRQLQILKRDMGFRGFVQSDWYATTKLSVAEGLDQEMPGNNLPPYPRGGWFGPEALEKVDSKMIDDSALRILAAMYRTGLFDREDGCSPPSCGEFQRANVTSDDHAALARRIATESVVLLKNERDLLPVPAGTQKIAVVGAAAAAPPNNHAEITDSAGDYYSAGGSGHVVGPYVITPLDGISQRAEAAGVEVIQSPSNDISAAVAAAKAADITVVVAATTCSEGADRTNLTLDGDADAFIEAVAAASSQVVVLAQAPGVFLTPWRDSVSAVLAMFLGGQETGAAWGAVLFGDHAPTGRLPVMLPASEASVIPTSDEDTVVYSEGLATSYRNPEFEAAFPFGHGLTYTSFRYGRLRSRDCDGEVCISMKLSNSGKKKGRAVPQLYLEFPTEASQPAKVLKGFEKTALIEPGASTHVTFRLSARDRSYWLDGAWVPVTRFQVHVGESSTDIRRSKWVHADEFESPLVVV